LVHVDFAPVVSISALSGQRIERIFPVIDRIISSHRRRIPTGKLNKALERWTMAHPPPSGRTGRRPKLLYATQASVAPPLIVIFAARTERLPEEQYRRYLINRLREEFDFEGTAMRLSFRKRASKGGRGSKSSGSRPSKRKTKGRRRPAR
jgi:GTP-binding protein